MAVPTFTKSGAKATTPAKLAKSVFGLEVKNHRLLQEAYTAYLAKARNSHATAKTRGDVSGGGQKPWRQKGTGRARFGSSRNPIWRGGGTAFGPTGKQNYIAKINLNSKRLALCQALSLAAKEDRIKVVESFNFSSGKVKDTLKLFRKINSTGSILLILDKKDQLSSRATANLSKVKAIQAKYLTVYDILNADSVIVSKEALEIVERWLGEAK